jgi:hypothetical protein
MFKKAESFVSSAAKHGSSLIVYKFTPVVPNRINVWKYHKNGRGKAVDRPRAKEESQNGDTLKPEIESGRTSST